MYLQDTHFYIFTISTYGTYVPDEQFSFFFTPRHQLSLQLPLLHYSCHLIDFIATNIRKQITLTIWINTVATFPPPSSDICHDYHRHKTIFFFHYFFQPTTICSGYSSFFIFYFNFVKNLK